MDHDTLALAFVGALFIGIGFVIGGTVGSCTQQRDDRNLYNSRAVTNGRAIRVLDSASGEVKTVWKDGKP